MLPTVRELKTWLRFKDYAPQKITFGSAASWLRQFPNDKKSLEFLLDKVIYLSQKQVRKILRDQNSALVRKLNAAGLPDQKLIYMSVHDAGSSSSVILNMLRNMDNLGRKGCVLLDAHDTSRITEITNELKEGAIVYVDDFVGSGTQFCRERDFVVRYIVGNFTECLLVPAICDEGYAEVTKRGIDVFYGRLHSKVERPLHHNCADLDLPTKQRLIDICTQINPERPLGFSDLASMVVLYSNAPNNVPVLLRGNENQTPVKGIFPRTDDLPL